MDEFVCHAYTARLPDTLLILMRKSYFVKQD